jgi:GGDEF domain-containing protein
VTVDVGLSIGIAVAADEATAESLLVRADAALYSAKQLGRNRFMAAVR